MPIQTILDRGFPGEPAPLEGADETKAAGMEAEAKSNFFGSLGGTGIAKLMESFGTGDHVSHDDAAKALKDQGYDDAGVPKEGWTSGALQTEMNRQSIIKINQNIADRAHLGSTSRFVSGLAGGFADPVNLALLPIGGELAGAGKSVATRFVIGGAVGGAYSGAADVAQNAMTGHSDDDLSLNSLRDILWGTAIGGGLHATFGGKSPKMEQPRIEPGAMTLENIDKLERSDAAARRMGVSVNEVESPKGAVGKHQITPDTAVTYGFDPSRLHEPEYADRVGNTILAALNKHFKNDGEAVAIAWNAGPGVADRWLRAGRDDRILPSETQDYLDRYRKGQAPRYTTGGDISTAVDELPPKVRENAAKTALYQFAADSPVNVQPVIDAGLRETYSTNPFKIRDEHDLEIQRLETEGMQNAVPEHNSRFANDEGDQRAQIDATPEPPKPTEDVGPLVAEATEHMNNALTDAKEFAPILGEEQPASFENKMGEGMEMMKSHDEFQKAVDAAVRCGGMRGFG